MIRLPQSRAAWNTADFESILKQELEQLDVRILPLQQGLSQSSYVVEARFQVMVISANEFHGVIRAKTGIFYKGIIPGCSCADDPTPDSEYAEYCELQLDIDKASAETRVTLMA